MKVSVSSLNFLGVDTPCMEQLPLEAGLEMFVEFGDDCFWEGWLEKLMRDRTGKLSIHGPYQNLDLSDPLLDERFLERSYRRTFGIAHRWKAAYVVIHPNAPFRRPDQERELSREIARRRIAWLSHMAEEYDVPLCIENMGYGNSREQLFDAGEYLKLFLTMPELWSLIDIGKIHLAGWDLEELVKGLGQRILAYHLHDNNGREDQHRRIGEGSCLWENFRQVYGSTPQARLVLEYLGVPLYRVLEDIRTVSGWIEKFPEEKASCL